MAFDLEGARQAGYTDAEIADYLAPTVNFDISAARQAGYADSEILKRLETEIDPGVFRAAGRGLAHGTLRLAEDVGTGLKFVGNRLDSKGMVELGESVEQYWGDKAKPFEPPQAIQGSIVEDPALLAKGSWWAYNIFDTIPSLAASIIPGAGAYKAIKVGGTALELTPQVISRLAVAGGALTGGAAGGSLEGAQTYREVLNRGGDESEAAAAGTAMAGASALLNALSVGTVVSPGKLGALKRFLTTGATEALTEWAEEPSEGAILSATSVAKPEDDPVARAKEGANVAPIAFLVGGGAGLITRTQAPTRSHDEEMAQDLRTVAAAPSVDEAIARANAEIENVTAGTALDTPTGGLINEATQEPVVKSATSPVEFPDEQRRPVQETVGLLPAEDAELRPDLGIRESAGPTLDAGVSVRPTIDQGARAVDQTARDVERDQRSDVIQSEPGFGEPAALEAGQEVTAPSSTATAPSPEGVAVSGPTIDDAAHEAATSELNDLPEPTEAMKEAGNYKVGRVRVGGLDISIENPAGSERSGNDPNGEPWSVTMSAHYGYIRRTEGSDGEQVDVYVKPGTPEDWSGTAFVVDQIDPKTGRFDEHKVVMAADSLEEAMRIYDAHFSDQSGPTRRAAITPMPMGQFKQWLAEGDTTKPAAGVLPSATQIEAPAGDVARTAIQAPAVRQQLFAVGPDGKRYPVESLEDASNKWSQARDVSVRQGGGGSAIGGGVRIVDQSGKEVARVSYNGRVWPPGEWKSGLKPLYDPSGGTLSHPENRHEMPRTIEPEQPQLAAPKPDKIAGKPVTAIPLPQLRKFAEKGGPRIKPIAQAEIDRRTQEKEAARKERELEQSRSGPSKQLISMLLEWGGVNKSEALDVASDKGVRGLGGAARIFRTPRRDNGRIVEGHGLDDIALRLSEKGWLSPAELESADGGVETVRQMIREALEGRLQPVTARDVERRMQAETQAREEAAAAAAAEGLEPTPETVAEVDELANALQALTSEEIASLDERFGHLPDAEFKTTVIQFAKEKHADQRPDAQGVRSGEEARGEETRAEGPAQAEEVTPPPAATAPPEGGVSTSEIVRFRIPHPTQGTQRRAGKVVAQLPDGRYEIRGQDGGIYKLSRDEFQTRAEWGRQEGGASPLELRGETEAEIQQREQREREAAAQRERDEREAEQRTQADRERESFNLTGSDRAADTAAAAGQQDLLSPNPMAAAATALRNAADAIENAVKPARTKSDVEADLATLTETADARRNDATDESIKAQRPTATDWMTPEEFERYQQLQAELAPLTKQDRAGAQARVDQKRAERVKAESIADFGEKIGGARKDTSQPTGSRGETATESVEPGWRKRFSISQITSSTDPDENGKWVIRDERKKDWRGQARQIGQPFATKEAAEKGVEIAAVARNHRVVMGGTKDNTFYTIWRDVTERKRVQVVKQEFKTREDAMRYMAEHAVEIVETKTSFGEEILAKPDTVTRTGVERRSGPATAEMFTDTFGFRGVEFGLWNNQDERQDVMNHAYDGLLDLADVLGVPAKALSLNGDLALAFGARGQGLSGAKAHYERDYGVINLTKMTGAGSLAHEWMHAADHYFGRQDTKAKSEKIKNEAGDMVYPASTPRMDYASHGFRATNSQVREALRAAYTDLMNTMFTKAEQYVEDTQKAEKFVGGARERLSKELQGIRDNLTRGPEQLTYMKRNNKPATSAQLAEFDVLAERLISGQDLATEFRYNQSGNVPASKRGAMAGRHTNDTLDAMSVILKAVRGRQGFNSENTGPLDNVRGLMKLYRDRIAMLESANAKETKTKRVPTSYAMDAKRIDEGRASDYWTTEHEMAARAFSAYVEDKIAEHGNRSEFLAYGSDNNLFQYRLLNVRPFPEGEERKAINAAFDRLFSEIQTKETERGVTMFSRGDQIDTPAFREWFGESKVVDAEGKPLRVYHGTSTPSFTKFKPQRGGWSGGFGMWFGSDPEIANQFAKQRFADQGAAVYPVYLAINNPMVYEGWAAFTEAARATGKTDIGEMQRSLRNSLIRRGHDGVVIRGSDTDMGGSRDDWVAFKSTQIKSAVGNRGTFDSNNPDITLSRADSFGTGIPLRDAQAVAANIRRALPGAPPIHVHERLNQAPKALQQMIRSRNAEGDVEAAFHEGEVHVFPQNIASVERMEFVVGHHELRHYGLRAMLGPKMDGQMIALYSKNAALKRDADRKIRDGFAESRSEAVEEALADMPVAEVSKLTGIDRLIAAIRNALRVLAQRIRGMGLRSIANPIEPKEWTDNDVLALVARAEAMSLRQDAPYRAGGTALMTAYHGSPHEFDEFKLQKIGEGQGAQSFGWGLYFASKREVAEWYRDVLTPMDAPKTGRLYQVDLAPEESAYLAWDKEVTAEQLAKIPQNVRDSLESYLQDNTDLMLDELTGRELYQLIVREASEGGGITADLVPGSENMEPQEQASRYLASIGIPGIKYLDGGSRGKGEGTFNYVLFDESLVKIEAKLSRLEVDHRRRQVVMGIAAALATGATSTASAGNLTLGKAKPVDASIMSRQVSAEVAKILRGNGRTNLRGAQALKQALNEIASSGLAEVRALAKEIASLLPEKGLLLTVDDKGLWNAHGAVTFKPVPHLQLFTAKGRTGLTYATLLHEALHAAIAARYHSLAVGSIRSNDGKLKLPAPAASPEIAQFIALWREFQKVARAERATDKALAGSLEEAADDPDEFFVRALTDPVLQKYLASKPYEGKTLWQRFKDWIATSILGFRKSGIMPSWLDAALEGARDINAAMVKDEADFKRVAAINSFRGESSARSAMFSRAATADASYTSSRASWDAPEPGKLDAFIRVLQDKHIDTKRIVQAIKNATGALKDTVDVYLQEELFHGRASKGVHDFLDGELRPLLTEMAARGIKTPEDSAAFEEYLWARHAEERNAQIARVNEDMPDGGSGLTNEEAKAILDGVDPVKKRAYEALAKRVDAINTNTRQMLVAYQLESPDAIKAWEETYKSYVPLHREDMEGVMGIGQGYSVRGPSTRRAKGSKRAVVDILGNIAMQRERAIVRGEKNRVGLALYGLAKSNPNPDFWTLAKPGVVTQTNVETGEPVQVLDMSYQKRENVVMARALDKDGKVVQHGVEFNERDERASRMALALKNLDAHDLGEVLGLSAKITRYFASINTQYNPVFGLVNLTRDTQGALFNLSSTPLAGKQAEVLKHTISALRGIYIDERASRKGEQPKSAWAELWDEFQKEGGQTGYRDMFRTSKDRAEDIERELKRVAEGKAKGFGRAVFDWLSDYNQAMENAVRLAAYKVAKESGLTNQRAASLAKNLTVNFNRRGSYGTQIGALYAFFNASVQGTARLAETLKGPAGKKIITGGLMLGAMQALLLAAMGFDEDEPPDFVRERNLIIPIGDKKYITVPMPLGLHILPNLSRIPTEFVLSGFRDPHKRIAQLVNAFADAFNPVGNAGLSLQTIAPTLIDPVAALAENKDWTGKPIAREDFNKLAPTPGHTRAKETASEFSKAVSKALNWLSGGTNYQPGIFSPTPDQIDYLIGQVTGGLGREAMKVEQTVTSSITGEELPTYKIPVLSRFYGSSEGQVPQASRFYDNLREINQHEAEIKGRRKAGEPVADYLQSNPDARLWKQANHVERQVSKLRRHRRTLIEKGADPEQVKAIDNRITDVMRRFNERVRSLRDREAA